MAGYRSEEDHGLYQTGGFHPVHLVDVFHCRYEVLRKLGYGRYSTVWLVKDQRRDDPLMLLFGIGALLAGLTTTLQKLYSLRCFEHRKLSLGPRGDHQSISGI
ncbi:unnamed protein product [Penicillium nalgiovense]|nr:unnamed protein product [Penicillium nalgiovense]